jgi:hypothetical protein
MIGGNISRVARPKVGDPRRGTRDKQSVFYPIFIANPRLCEALHRIAMRSEHPPRLGPGHWDISFVGRPFPLQEVDEHFRRLKRWGFTFLRLLTTWEAIEHAGPGQCDLDYLDYLTAVVRKAGEHGMSLFIDPHQDVWSRFTGGDGAPII